jgi:hypothetical protein
MSARHGSKIGCPDHPIPRFPDNNLWRFPDKAGHQEGFAVLSRLPIKKYGGFPLFQSWADRSFRQVEQDKSKEL